jgi:hypothetical protein
MERQPWSNASKRRPSDIEEQDMRRLVLIASLTSALVLGATACSIGGNDSEKSAPAATTLSGNSADMRAGAVADTANVDGGQGKPIAKPTGSTVLVQARAQTSREHIIKNASISIETKDVAKARNDAVARAEAVGADVTSEQRAGVGPARSATITFRVSPGEFDGLVTSLGNLGTVVESTTTTEDVTGQVADVEGRIRAAKDSAEKIRALIARAEKITDLVALEREFAARDAEIQSMTGQVESLKERAARSTITLSIGPETERSKSLPGTEKKEATGFMGGLKSGVDAFASTATVIATATGALLPFAAIALLALLIWWAVRRRGPRSPAVDVAPAGPSTS